MATKIDTKGDSTTADVNEKFKETMSQPKTQFLIIGRPQLIQKVDGEMLNENTFEAKLDKMVPTTPVLIQKGCTLGKHQEQLQNELKKRNMTVIIENCEVGDLHGYAAVSPRGKYVAVKNELNGRKQHVHVFEDEVPAEDLEPDDSKDAQPALTEKEIEDLERDDDSANEEDSEDSSDEESDNEEGKMLKEVSLLAESKGTHDDLRPDEHHTSLQYKSLKSPEMKIDDYPRLRNFPKILNKYLKRGRLGAFCTIDIKIYATNTTVDKFGKETPEKKKWIQFTLKEGEVGILAKMGINKALFKGLFNHSVKIQLFPGPGNDPYKADDVLPDWRRPSIEPQGENRTIEYTKTTGFTCGTELGVDKNGPNLGLKASYSSEKGIMKSSADFTVVSKSYKIMSGWKWYYTDIEGDIAPIANSTYHLGAEVIYQAPANTNEEIKWNFRFKCKWAALIGGGRLPKKVRKKRVTLFKSMSIDMGEVQFME